LLLALLCVLLQPTPIGPFAAGGWVRACLLDIPILAANTFAAAAFYLVAQRELNPQSWYRDILFFPFVLALGIGVSVNNARAVLEAVFNHRSAFNRTPKYGIEGNTQRAPRFSYSAFKAVLPLGELLFAVYFAHFVIAAFAAREYLSLPFLMLFEIGFTYVAFCSIGDRLRRWPGKLISVR
jgi:hypothetical protein